MTTIKNIILTAISFKGITQVKQETKELADKCMCTESYIKKLIRKIEKGEIIIKNK